MYEVNLFKKQLFNTLKRLRERERERREKEMMMRDLRERNEKDERWRHNQVLGSNGSN